MAMGPESTSRAEETALESGSAEKPRLRKRVGVALVVGTVVAAGSVAVMALRQPDGKAASARALIIGDCVQAPKANADDPVAFWKSGAVDATSLDMAPCDRPHAGEVFFTGDMWDEAAPYPGEEVVTEDTRRQCQLSYEEYVGSPVDYSMWYPEESAWESGDRGVGCIAIDPAGDVLEHSIKRASHVTFSMRLPERLSPGDCVADPDTYADGSYRGLGRLDMPAAVAVLPCDQSHAGEVFFAGDLWQQAGEYPDDKTMARDVFKRCDIAFEKYVSIPVAYDWWVPDEQAWQDGSRTVACVAFDSQNLREGGSLKRSPTDEHTVKLSDRLRPGDCLATPDEYRDDPETFWAADDDLPAAWTVVPCDQTHRGEVFYSGDTWEETAKYPGDNALGNKAFERCDFALHAYSGTYAGGSIRYLALLPNKASWEYGDRHLTCIATGDR